MTKKMDEEIVYSMNIADVQNVANQVLGRTLMRKEIMLVKESIGEYVDWFSAIEFAINKHIRN